MNNMTLTKKLQQLLMTGTMGGTALGISAGCSPPMRTTINPYNGQTITFKDLSQGSRDLDRAALALGPTMSLGGALTNAPALSLAGRTSAFVPRSNRPLPRVPPYYCFVAQGYEDRNGDGSIEFPGEFENVSPVVSAERPFVIGAKCKWSRDDTAHLTIYQGFTKVHTAPSQTISTLGARWELPEGTLSPGEYLFGISCDSLPGIGWGYEFTVTP